MIDWNKAPKWANWFTTSERGIGCWFQNKPVAKKSKKFGLRWDADGAREYIPVVTFERINILMSKDGEIHDIEPDIEKKIDEAVGA